MFSQKKHHASDSHGHDHGQGENVWERELIHKIVVDTITERRRSRRWNTFFKLLAFTYLFLLLVAFWSDDLWTSVTPGEKHTALVDVEGLIAPEADASADNVAGALRKAFEDKGTEGVILRLNSPGGSPVQSGYIHDEIKRLKEKYPDTPLYAVIADVCASGCYYAAVASDTIYADKASLVGSIGVRLGTFGFEKAIEELGIERRLLTAGENKGILDPFLPFSEEQRAFLQDVLDVLHEQFIGVVKEGRGERLKGGEELFSGLFWSGEQGIELGLIDELGSSGYVAREVIGADKIVEYTTKKDLIERLGDRLGASFAAGLGALFATDLPLAH